ncbi:MAG: hypothetical protein R3236_09650, partial [Phycisphaeraceae bacterium]|nr:hypothetical protein [Phycisphaeraceae bacterium]
PGVGLGRILLKDPRPPQKSSKEVGRGALDPSLARFLGIDLSRGAQIEYELGGKVLIRERFVGSKEGPVRQLKIAAHSKPVYLALSSNVEDRSRFRCSGSGVIELKEDHVLCRIEPSDQPQDVSVVYARPAKPTRPFSTGRRWPKAYRLALPPASMKNALNLESVPLPLKNDRNRAVRAAGIDFFKDGRIALVTFDGDVWLGDGLKPGSKRVTWKRFASGLHEPLGLRIRGEDIFVFDRNGVWRLLDRDGNGEADYHRLFCGLTDQTAETREFASGIELEPDGSFLIFKPGQNATGRSAGAILRISPDGKKVTRVADGFRQPFLGIDPKTGRIAASDQQGHYVPSTPVYFVREGEYFGHPNKKEDRKRPITPPLTWIPHQVCASGMAILWMRDAKMGPLNDRMVLLSYHPPMLMQVHPDVDQFVTQGGATVLDVPLGNQPVLKGALNPADGLLYLCGFKIWGTKAQNATFLARVRPNRSRAWTVPTGLRIEKRGILLTFAVPLDPKITTDTKAYRVRRWNYKRTSKYGSGNYKLNGKKGTENLAVASVKLSSDGRSLFLGIPNMRPTMQMEIGYKIATRSGTKIDRKTYLTAHLLRKLDLTGHGFADNKVNLKTVAGPVAAAKPPKPSAEKGARLYTQLGCIACHSLDGSTEGKTGPSWLGLYGSKRKLLKTGKVVTADEAYLRESILNPAAKVAEGAVNGEAG